MRNFKRWLTTKDNWCLFEQNGDKEEVERIILELNDQPIGVMYNDVFKCDYGFIGQVWLTLKGTDEYDKLIYQLVDLNINSLFFQLITVLLTLFTVSFEK